MLRIFGVPFPIPFPITLVLLSPILLLATAASAASDPTPRHFALLVGCTKYDHLAAQHHLEGPANDVPLFARLLQDKFGFHDADIRRLSESDPQAVGRPTYANIVREWQRLCEHAQAGDQIVILMGGHGSQIPDDDPENPDDIEDDGLDEVFLPADIRGWTGSSPKIENAIRDDELRHWLAEIRSKGAHVWVILDACHSGSMTRGNETETLRYLDPSVLFPTDALPAEAIDNGTGSVQKERGRPPQGAGSPKGDMDLSEFDAAGSLVATYAALPSEPTIEKMFPDDVPRAQRTNYGLLTYTICLVLSRADGPLTYRELMQRVYQQHQQWSRTFPTPLMEGLDLAREVIGEKRWPGRSDLKLEPASASGTAHDSNERRYVVNGGSLYGLTVNTILAVYPPAGTAQADQPIGYVRVTRVDAMESTVEPTAHQDLPPLEKLDDDARFEVNYIDYGLDQLKLALDKNFPDGPQFESELKKIAASDHPYLALIDQAEDAQWLLRRSPQGAVLVPAEGWLRTTDSSAKSASPVFGPAPSDRNLADWVCESTQRIARVTNLLRISEPFDGANITQGDDVKIQVDMLKFRDANDREGELVDASHPGFALQDGDSIGFRVTNTGRATAYATLLFVDSGYGITPFFPQAGTVADNRLEPGQVILRRAKVNSDTMGIERMVVLAVKAEGPPQDFTWLAQPTLEKARDLAASRSGPTVTPLGQLLEFANYGSGTTRGLAAEEDRACSIRYLTWKVY